MPILNFIVIGQYTINIPEIFQVFTVFEFDSNNSPWRANTNKLILINNSNAFEVVLSNILNKISP